MSKIKADFADAAHDGKTVKAHMIGGGSLYGIACEESSDGDHFNLANVNTCELQFTYVAFDEVLSFEVPVVTQTLPEGRCVVVRGRVWLWLENSHAMHLR